MQVDSSHLARRLSFGAAIDGEANRFPMHKFVEYFNDDLDSQLAFLKYTSMNSTQGLEIEQNLLKWTDQTQRLSEDLIKLMVQEQFYEALLNSDMSQIVAFAASVAEKKDAYEQSMSEKEEVSKETDRVIRAIDDSIAVICHHYDRVKQTREDIKLELDAINKKQQQEAAAAGAAAQQSSHSAEAPAAETALPPHIEKSMKINSVMFSMMGIQVSEVKEGELALQIGQKHTLVVRLKPDSSDLAEARIEPSVPSCDSIISRAIQSNDMSFLIREIRHRLANLAARQTEAQILQSKFGCQTHGLSSFAPKIRVSVGPSAPGVELEVLVHEEYPQPNPPMRLFNLSVNNDSAASEQMSQILNTAIASGEAKTVTELVGKVIRICNGSI